MIHARHREKRTVWIKATYNSYYDSGMHHRDLAIIDMFIISGAEKH